MFFKIKNKRYLSTEQLRTNALLDAYYIIQKYPLHASEVILDHYIQQQYKVSLKNMCVKLLLNLTFYKNDAGDLTLMFKDRNYDKIARLITYGNGAIQGSPILQIAFTDY
jgi:hypothetical protein